jgi:hypothetical protein
VEEVLTIFSGSENNSISNIKFPMHTALIFKEKAKVKGLTEKGLAQPHYSIQHIEGYDLLCYKEKIKNLAVVADALSRLDIDSLKIQEEEVLTLLS